MAYNNTGECSPMVKQDNINEISKTSSPDLEIQDMMTVDLYNSSMVSITYSDKAVKVGITFKSLAFKSLATFKIAKV